jgi:hypothetical protein
LGLVGVIAVPFLALGLLEQSLSKEREQQQLDGPRERRRDRVAEPRQRDGGEPAVVPRPVPAPRDDPAQVADERKRFEQEYLPQLRSAHIQAVAVFQKFIKPLLDTQWAQRQKDAALVKDARSAVENLQVQMEKLGKRLNEAGPFEAALTPARAYVRAWVRFCEKFQNSLSPDSEWDNGEERVLRERETKIRDRYSDLNAILPLDPSLK